MKIAYVTSYREDEANGISVVSFDLAEKIAESHEVAMICSGKKTEVTQDANYPTLHIESEGDNQLNIHNFSLKNVKFFFEFLDNFAPDVVHTHSQADLGLLAHIWANNNGVPFVDTFHSLPSQVSTWMNFGGLSLLPKSTVDFFSLHYFKLFVKGCDGIVALNKSVEDELEKLNYGGGIFTIPNGVDMRRFLTCKKADIEEDVLHLLFVGSLHPRKNQDFLIDVMRDLPEDKFFLHLIGQKQNEEYAQKVEDKIKSLKLSNVKVYGALPYDQVIDFYEKSHIFVSSSKAEVQSLVIIEALASGTPVISLANQTTTELIQDKWGKNFSVNVSSTKFAREIKQFAKLAPKEYEKYAHAARNSIKHLDWNVVVRQTVDMYSDLIKAKKQKKSSAKKQESLFTSTIIKFIPSGKVRRWIKNYLRKNSHKDHKDDGNNNQIQKTSKKDSPPKSNDNKPKLLLKLLILGAALFTIVTSVMSFYFLRLASKEQKGKTKK